MYVEIIGWAASLLLLLSFFMKNMSNFRWYNLAGSFLYVIYGFLNFSMPVIVFNLACCILNLYSLHYLYNINEAFSVCKVDKNEPLFNYFLNHYKNDISKLFTDFSDSQITSDSTSFLVLKNHQPIGVFILENNSENELSVILDYVAPSARNSKAGLFIHNIVLKELSRNKVQIVVSKIFNASHKVYLEKIGYTTSAVNARIIIR
ncbi:MAG TPA: hypothetical protein DD381_04030 [Lentisphaeria bacterium]|nr:MAG: hypothetical protein A2X47_06600 [Lentisphaerae bacterium GWF2_38_69]HBM15499.1 hypothetical protein [Lentisphaeria bacterium]